MHRSEHGAVAQPGRRPVVERWSAAIEPLWHRREVEVYGTLVRVTVPMIGAPISAEDAAQMQSMLDAQWRGRTLSLQSTIHSVVVEVAAHEGQHALVLLISIDESPRDHSIVGARMLRGLRSAIRATRQPGRPAHATSAAA